MGVSALLAGEPTLRSNDARCSKANVALSAGYRSPEEFEQKTEFQAESGSATIELLEKQREQQKEF